MNLQRPPLSTLVREALSRHIEQHCGIHLGPEKGYLLEHRLAPLLTQFKLQGFEGLRERLIDKQDPDLREKVLEAIATHETAFFRDKHPFESFRQTVLPQAAKRWVATRDSIGSKPMPIRIWCAACSTGQEPYSVAMAIHEWLPLCGVPNLTASDFSILATDLSSKVLESSKKATYSDPELARGMTPGQISRFMVKIPGPKPAHQFKPEIRAMVEFRRVNLQESFRGLGVFDVIFCRNVLIYFTDAFKRQICEVFHSILQPGGYLILGAAESLFGITDLFQTERVGDTLLYRRA